MTDEKKTNDGFYVVLHMIEDVKDQEVLNVVGRAQAHRPEEALKVVAGTQGLVGKFVVMPLRSWRVFEAAPSTVMQVKAVE